MDETEKKKWNEYGQKRMHSRNRLLHTLHRLETKFFLDNLKHINVDSEVLDIGCAEGFYLELLRDLGFKNLHGIDASAAKIDIAKGKGLDIQLGNAYDLNESNRYDLILLMDVLEHLDKPALALQNIQKALKDNGILYLNIPICDSLALRCWRLVSFKSRLDLLKDWDETHINAWTKRELCALIEKNGFKVEKASRVANRFPLIGRLSTKLSDLLQEITLFGTCGDFLSVVARKDVIQQ